MDPGVTLDMLHMVDDYSTPIALSCIRQEYCDAPIVVKQEEDNELRSQQRDGQIDIWEAINSSKNDHKKLGDLIAINNISNVNLPDRSGNTPLIWAAIHGYTFIAELLLQHRADVNRQNKDKYSALMLAVMNRHIDIVKILIDARADLDLQNKCGFTALILAAINNHAEIVKILVDNGADLKRVDKKHNTALTWAKFLKHGDVVNFLLTPGT